MAILEVLSAQGGGRQDCKWEVLGGGGQMLIRDLPPSRGLPTENSRGQLTVGHEEFQRQQELPTTTGAAYARLMAPRGRRIKSTTIKVRA